MKTHANADQSGLEHLLSPERRRNGAPGRGERDEERVTLRIHLHTVMPIDRLAQHQPMPRQLFGVRIAS